MQIQETSQVMHIPGFLYKEPCRGFISIIPNAQWMYLNGIRIDYSLQYNCTHNDKKQILKKVQIYRNYEVFKKAIM